MKTSLEIIEKIKSLSIEIDKLKTKHFKLHSVRTAGYETRTSGGVRGAPVAIWLPAIYSIVRWLFLFDFLIT